MPQHHHPPHPHHHRAMATLPPRVTPTTAALLRWWFGFEGFTDAARQAILRAIVSHEEGAGGQRPGGYPAWPLLRRIALPGGDERVPILLALLVWQLLNHRDALAAGADAPRFTRHFVIVAPHLIARSRLYNALCGFPRPGDPDGRREFGSADLARHAEWLIPAERREEVLGFVCAHVCSGARAVRRPLAESGAIAIASDRLEAAECLARMPGALVFHDPTRPPAASFWHEAAATAALAGE